jgi:hypothetical protein
MSTATDALASLNLHTMGEQPVMPNVNFDLAITRLAESVVGVTALDLSEGAGTDFLATSDQIRGAVILLQDATETRAVIVEELPFRRLFVNAMNFDIEFKCSVQPVGITVPALSTRELWCDGALVRELVVSAATNVENGLSAGQVPVWNPTTNLYEPGDLTAAEPLIISGFAPGQPEAEEMLYILPVVRAFRLPVGLIDSVFKLLTAATAAATVTIKKGAASVGTVAFAIGATDGVVTFAAAVDFEVGDELRIIAPTLQDETLEGIVWAIKGALI